MWRQFNDHDLTTHRAQTRTMAPAKDPALLRRELVGWYIYDFANSAYFQSAMTVRLGTSASPNVFSNVTHER
jgi:MFS-type transporter involved in bile tolerance (Atg22 family)|tara:strand:- start:6401 stop:6616 length:216 start_codon:yes stop_codon:yes gene_type:complete